MIYRNVLGLIGNTPMVKINKLTGENDATVLAKLESYNVAGSLKDRMALYIIEDAEKQGLLTKDKIILEASSGNTGIAMAMIAGVKGYKIKIVIPESVSIERRKLIKAYGAELILSSGEKGTGGAVELKNKLLAQDPKKYINPDQFKNQANIKAHYQTTGQEILKQTAGNVDVVIVGIGTAGTGVGISRRLKEYNSNIQIIAVLPELGVPIQGLRNPRELNPTHLLDKKAFDEIVEIPKELVSKTYLVARNLAHEEGILSGMSSGAVMYIALKKAKELGKNKTIVAILPDTGERYLSTNLFE
ncbi:MAG: PLP-dependent cysteine synthase family protein [Patescibacteria group bacterium]|nr:PLP-dependent cysteine synthase family protein [Patescibacteria group bacterium]